MPRFRDLFAMGFLLFAAPFSLPCRAKLLPTYDLATLCFQSTAVVEARIVRHHLSGQEEWKDTFTATVTSPLEGGFHAGDPIFGLDLSLYDPARTGQRCLLFLARDTPASAEPPRVVSMLLVDSRSRVRRYYQESNPGGLVAEGFRLVPIAPPSHIKVTRRHGHLVYSYQENDGYVEDDSAEPRYPALADERALILTKWTAAKKLKAPPFQVLQR